MILTLMKTLRNGNPLEPRAHQLGNGGTSFREVSFVRHLDVSTIGTDRSKTKPPALRCFLKLSLQDSCSLVTFDRETATPEPCRANSASVGNLVPTERFFRREFRRADPAAKLVQRLVTNSAHILDFRVHFSRAALVGHGMRVRLPHQLVCELGGIAGWLSSSEGAKSAVRLLTSSLRRGGQNKVAIHIRYAL